MEETLRRSDLSGGKDFKGKFKYRWQQTLAGIKCSVHLGIAQLLHAARGHCLEVPGLYVQNDWEGSTATLFQVEHSRHIDHGCQLTCHIYSDAIEIMVRHFSPCFVLPVLLV
jgi:hypothetical protein